MTQTLTTERMAEIAKLAIRLQQISRCAAVTSSGETVLHHTHVDEILSALHDVTAELLANREAQPVAVTDEMALAFHRALNDGGIGESDLEEIKVGLRGALCNITTPPAPAVEESGARRCCKDKKCNAPIVGYSVDGLCEDCYMEMSKRPAPVVNPEFTSATAVPELITEDEQEEAVSDGYADSFRGGWNACRAAMLAQPQIEPQNIPNNIPDGLAAAVNRLLDSDGSRGCFSAVRSYDAREEIERLLAQPVSQGCKLVPVEPTAEMIQSGIAAHYERQQLQIHDRPAPGPMECAYIAMLAAAPEGGNEK